MENVERHLVHSFAKAEGEEIQVAVRRYKGRYFIDLRQWFEDQSKNTFFPTKKGVCFPLEHATELSKSAERVLKLSQKLLNPRQKPENPD